MKNKIIDETGNIFEYNQENGLISKNDIILSGDQYEPVFSKFPDDSQLPVFVGIYFKHQNKLLSKSGKLNSITNSRQL